MAFADPQSVTIDGTAISLPRVSSGVNAGAFKSNDGLTALSANHQSVRAGPVESSVWMSRRSRPTRSSRAST